MTTSERDNLEEFQDPVMYDCEFGGPDPARDFYLGLARDCGGEVLELACGTGLALLPIAAAGIPCTGVDVAAPMINHARQKTGNLPARFVEGDARRVRLDRRFSFVFLAGNAFQSFLTESDQHALLETVRRHLLPKGRFAFETRNPGGTELGDEPEEIPWHRFSGPDGEGVEVSGTQQYDVERQWMTWTTWRQSATRRWRTRIVCRFTEPEALDNLLESAGLVVHARYGDWSLAPLREDSPAIISVCGLA